MVASGGRHAKTAGDVGAPMWDISAEVLPGRRTVTCTATGLFPLPPRDVWTLLTLPGAWLERRIPAFPIAIYASKHETLLHACCHRRER